MTKNERENIFGPNRRGEKKKKKKRDRGEGEMGEGKNIVVAKNLLVAM